MKTEINIYGNSKVVSVCAVKVCGANRCIAPFVLNLGSRWPLGCWGNKGDKKACYVLEVFGIKVG